MADCEYGLRRPKRKLCDEPARHAITYLDGEVRQYCTPHYDQIAAAYKALVGTGITGHAAEMVKFNGW